MAKSYYDDSTALLKAYLGTSPEKRIEFVRQLIGSDDSEVDLNKVHKQVDAILLTVEKARGQLASQLALAYCTTAPAGQLALFGTSESHRRAGLMFEENDPSEETRDAPTPA